ncbi:polysaccharide pyruvyl transferase family protein [Candidatus Saccharibacteria bacterium]|nr:polysaccharide pyruvyl transferase family protein [Candidatus Saccharibacteria bacterium]
MKSQIKNLPDLPLGDPGLLASIIYPKSAKKNHKIGLVHHYIDADNAIVSNLRKNDNFLIINPLDPPKEVATQISSCDFILSSSLHGLIVADSYNIPNAHIKLSDKVYGGEYKFNDYDSGVNKTHLEADTNKIHDLNYINTLKSQYQPIKNLQDIQKTIIAAFPKI